MKRTGIRSLAAAIVLLMCTACGQGTSGTPDTTEASAAAVVSETTAETTEEATEEVSEETSQQETAETTETETVSETEEVSEAANDRVELEVKDVSVNRDEFFGWEFPTAAALLNYYGFNCDYMDLLDCVEIVRRDDTFTAPKSPFDAYVGDPTLDYNCYCYSPVFTDMLNNYISNNGGGYTAVDISGTELNDLVSEISEGNPVAFWSSTDFFNGLDVEPKLAIDEYIGDGTRVKRVGGDHVMLITGYDSVKKTYKVTDVFIGESIELPADILKKYYDFSDKMAVVIHKS